MPTNFRDYQFPESTIGEQTVRWIRSSWGDPFVEEPNQDRKKTAFQKGKKVISRLQTGQSNQDGTVLRDLSILINTLRVSSYHDNSFRSLFFQPNVIHRAERKDEREKLVFCDDADFPLLISLREDQVYEEGVHSQFGNSLDVWQSKNRNQNNFIILTSPQGKKKKFYFSYLPSLNIIVLKPWEKNRTDGASRLRSIVVPLSDEQCVHCGEKGAKEQPEWDHLQNDVWLGARLCHYEGLEGEFCNQCFRLHVYKCQGCQKYGLRRESVMTLHNRECHRECVEALNQRIIEVNSSISHDRIWLPIPSIRVYQPGVIYKSRRLVGAEIEVANVPNYVRKKVLPTIGIAYDGSIRGNDNNDGAEFVTPPANGVNFEALAGNVLDSLNDSSAKINSSCGLHLHFNLADFSDEQVMRLLLTYYLTSAACNLWVRPSRIENRYCAPMNHIWSYSQIMRMYESKKIRPFLYDYTNFMMTKDEQLKDLKENLNFDRHQGGSHGPRYMAQNFISVYYRGTLEIRQHEGTADLSEILHYAYFNAQMIAYARGKRWDFDALHDFYKERNRDLSRLSGREDIEAFAQMVGLHQATKKRLYERAKQNYGII